LKIGGKQILNTVSGSCHHGQISAILGVSGKEKSLKYLTLNRSWKNHHAEPFK